MTDGKPVAALRHVRALFSSGTVGGESDGHLLERFQARRDDAEAEMAFAVLVARHGPLVMGVCRRALRDPNDADDAFQATFLVLARKAGSVRVEGSLGRWLYGVSRRIAARARASSAKRANQNAVGTEPEVKPDDFERRELLSALDEEVARLPDRFRAAIVLCDLGGLTHEAAATQLGCPVGTVESRLSRGRNRLRERLTRRGFAPTAAAALPGSVPESLSATTVRAAARVAEISAAVTTLMEGVLKEMAWIKIKTLTLGLGAAALTCGLGIVATGRLEAKNPPREKTERVEQKPMPKDEPIVLEPPAKIKPGDTLLVEVLEALPGRPLTGERLVRPDGTITLGFYGDVKVAGLNRHEIKAAVIDQMLKFLPEEVLGLVEQVEENGVIRMIKISPVDSNRVYIDDTFNYGPKREVSDDTSRKLDTILRAIERLNRNESPLPRRNAPPARGPGGVSTSPLPPLPPERSPFQLPDSPRPTAPPGEALLAKSLADQERRLAELEAKLDGLIKAIEGLKAERNQ